MKNNKVPVLLFVLFQAVPAMAQTLDLEQCREMALESNKQITISHRQAEQAGYTLKSYKANFLPKFTGEGMYLFSGGELKENTPELFLPTYVPDPATGRLTPNVAGVGADGNPVFKQYGYVPPLSFELSLNNTFLAGVSVEQPLYMGGKITAAYKMACIGKDISRVNMAFTRTDILVRTDEAYWQVVKVKELLAATGKYRDAVAGLLQNVSDACAAGMKSKNDFLKVQVKLNEAELMVRKAQNGVRLAKMNLCHYIGLPLQTDVDVSARFAGADSAAYGSAMVPALPAADVTARPEYELLSRQIEYKHQQTKLVRSDFLPNLGVSAAYMYTEGLRLNDEKLLSSGSFSALFSLKVPLFHWGEGVNKVRAAKAEKTIALLQREDALEKMELEAMQALNALDEAVLEVNLTRRSLAQAEENLKVSRDHYEAGMETLTGYMEAQAAWQKAWADLIEAEAGMRFSETYYLKAIGQLK
ncbi:MAG: TolC family protein [Parabacteroides sp.]|nr:TolC family protein [Parabacteroides sp.]